MATDPLEAGDFVMVAGYPGSTSRYALFDEFQAVVDWQYPVGGQHLKNLVAIVDAAGQADPEIEVKYASTIRGWQNNMKNWDGQLEGFRRINATATKRAEEDAVLAWLRSRGNDGKPALDAHARLVQLAADARATRVRDTAIGQMANVGLLGNVRGLYRLAIERAKPNAERRRLPGPRPARASRATPASSTAATTRRWKKQPLAYWLAEYVKLPADQRVPAVDAWLGGNDAAAINRALDATYAATRLGTVDGRLALLTTDRAGFRGQHRPAAEDGRGPAADPDRAGRHGPRALARTAAIVRCTWSAVQAYKRAQGPGCLP